MRQPFLPIYMEKYYDLMKKPAGKNPVRESLFRILLILLAQRNCMMATK